MSFRRVFIAGLTALMAIGGIATIGASTARAASAITLPGDLAFPESLAASSDGTLFIGSAKMGGVVRVAPGSSTPTSWITPTTFGTRSIFGVLVDEHAGMLWTCSNDLASDGIASPGSGAGSALKGFDLKSGAGKISAPFPGNHPLCNDIAVAKDGRVYVSDEYSARVLRLSTDSHTLEVWVSDPQLPPPPRPGLYIALPGGSIVRCL
jgi:streptogramin lyase